MLSLIHSLMDVKQGQNKQGKTVLYLVFEYMDTDLKKFIRSFLQTGENIPVKNVKVYKFNVTPFFFIILVWEVFLLFFLIWSQIWMILIIMQSLMYQLCKGVAFCHGHGVLHRFPFILFLCLTILIYNIHFNHHIC